MYKPDSKKATHRPVDSMTRNIRVDAIDAHKCALCSNAEVEFRDKASLDEYYISGLCQECQDKVFGT